MFFTSRNRHKTINNFKKLKLNITELTKNKKLPTKKTPIYRNGSHKILFNGNDLSKILSQNSLQRKSIKKTNIPFFNKEEKFNPLFIINKKHKISSLKEILYKKNNILEEMKNLPKIKPRKIIIDYYSGSDELRINNLNLNKKFDTIINKKYGHNGSFMGDKYNPENYHPIPKNKFSKNYYGALFQN